MVIAPSLRIRRLAVPVMALALLVSPVGAVEEIVFQTPGADEALEDQLRAASILLGAQEDGLTDTQDLFTDARAEYASLLGALYAAGHYSGVIHVYLDGREAAGIAALDAPQRIDRIEVVVQPGPAFTLSQAQVAPLPRRTELPAGFAPGQPAQSGVVLEAATAGVDAWRAQGHAKARVADQDVVANHRTAQLAADITLDPGPRLRFGPLTAEGNQRLTMRRLLKIAGLPEGEVYDPEEVEKVRDRLRRTGIFRSISLTEAEDIQPPDLLPFHLSVVEEKPRHYSFGAEVTSTEGARLTAQWIHRNLLGGGERLTLGAEVTNIGAQNSGMDWTTSAALSRPATFTADTTLTFEAEVGQLDEEDYTADTAALTLGLTHLFSTSLTGRAGGAYEYSKVTDATGVTTYRNFALPLGLTWDRRNSTTDATRGFYIDAEAKPFFGLGVTDSGARLALDARAYRGFGARNGFVLAARMQVGAILGASLLGTPRDYLFYSGGGGTVRGQPYQSLGVNVLRSGINFTTGGTHFIGGSVEGRVKVTESIGVVAFVDVGRVDAAGFFDTSGDWHAGAGLGLRYATAVGPIRLDLAMPVGGDTGDGLQIYVGLGQAF